MKEESQVSFEEIEHRAVQAQQKAIDAKKEFTARVMSTIRIALDVLSAKALVIYSLTLMAGAFAWSLVEPSVLRVIAATLFSLIVILAKKAGLFEAGNGD